MFVATKTWGYGQCPQVSLTKVDTYHHNQYQQFLGMWGRGPEFKF